VNDAGPNVIQTDLKSEFCVVAGETGTSDTMPVAGFKPLLGMLCRSKKLDKTSRLVRIQHRIFRSLHGRETVLSSVRASSRSTPDHAFCKIWFCK
jgi:hypothetical protein